MQVGGGELTPLHDALKPIMKLHQRNISSPLYLCSSTKDQTPISERRVCIFSFNSNAHPLTTFLTKKKNKIHFLLSSVIIRSDKTSCLFIHFTVWYSSLNPQYEQSLWKHYKQNNLLKNQTRTRRAGVGQDEDMKLILEGEKICS